MIALFAIVWVIKLKICWLAVLLESHSCSFIRAWYSLCLVRCDKWVSTLRCYFLFFLILIVTTSPLTHVGWPAGVLVGTRQTQIASWRSFVYCFIMSHTLAHTVTYKKYYKSIHKHIVSHILIYLMFKVKFVRVRVYVCVFVMCLPGLWLCDVYLYVCDDICVCVCIYVIRGV